MNPDALFQAANTTALAGWLVLAASPWLPVWADRISGIAIPALLSIGYAALILTYWSGAQGGFDTLANVMTLFTRPEIVLAGWVHYLAFDLHLAFDLLIGAWEVRTGRAEGIAFLLVLPCLALTLLFGPIGFLAFLAIRASRGAARAPQRA